MWGWHGQEERAGGIGSPYFLVPLWASGHNPEKFMNF